jgi:hypothetical protein
MEEVCSRQQHRHSWRADCELVPFAVSARFLSGHLSAFLARFGKANGDRLFSTFDGSAFAAFSGFQGSALSSAHRTADRFAGCFSISCHGDLLLS